jgi:hypothetical protein
MKATYFKNPIIKNEFIITFDEVIGTMRVNIQDFDSVEDTETFCQMIVTKLNS